MQTSKSYWNEIWKQKIERGRQSALRRECATLWQGREEAEKYWRKSIDPANGRLKPVINGLKHTRASRILDIGAGPGTVAVALANEVEHITIVEPAEGMLSLCRENLAERHLTNVRLVQKRWEEVESKDLEMPYDIVLAAFSLGMPDLQAAIDKMNAFSSKAVYLFWFLGKPTWTQHRIQLWPFLHGQEYPCQAEADVIYNLLIEMGIYPDVSMHRYTYRERYFSLEALLAAERDSFFVTTPAQEEIFRNYFAERIQPQAGFWWDEGQATFAKISWEK